MKKKIAAAAFAAAFFLLGGCIPSLHPLYTKDKLVEVKELSGLWTPENQGNFQVSYKSESGQPESWKFNYVGDKAYRLIHQDEQGVQAAFDVHVIKLGKNYFIDFYPSNSEEGLSPVVSDIYKMNSMQQVHLLPVHTFAKLELTSTEMKISMFDPDFVGDLLEHQQIRIKHENTANGFVLTASSEELQKFAEKYADNKEAFLEPTVLQNKMKE